jgi:hypothetical protein
MNAEVLLPFGHPELEFTRSELLPNWKSVGGNDPDANSIFPSSKKPKRH